MSTVMALTDLYCIHNYVGNQTLGRLGSDRRNVSNRTPLREGGRFKNILSSLQTHPFKNVFKTKGLTIADYRAQAVISKSRPKIYPRLASLQLKNTSPNRFADPEPPAVMKKDKLKSQSRSPQKIQAGGSIERTRSKGDQQKVEAMTTRTAGGSDFTASGGIRKTRLTELRVIDQNVQKAAAKYDLSPDLIRAVIRAESNFQVRAVSSAGAQGLMQLMPATARELGVQNPFDIGQNIDGGAKYLRRMLDRFDGNVRKALAAYNAGPGTVIKYNGRVPYPETRQYVTRVLRFSRQMA